MKSLLVKVLLLIVIFWVGVGLSGTAIRNVTRIQTAKTWMSLDPKNVIRTDALQDGIPDAWFYYAWGSATQIYRLDEREALAGHHAAVIERTNAQGGATLAQDLMVQPDTRFVVTVYAKGTGGAMHVWFRDQGTLAWMKEGRKGLAQSETWQQHRLSVAVPSGVSEARLLLQGEGLTFFDEAYVGEDHAGDLGPNALKNPGFEQDGISQDPLEWWLDHVVALDPVVAPEDDALERLSYLNVADMLAGRYDVVKQRAFALGDDCASTPAMTSWLIARGDDFEQTGGAAARERLYQLAVELAPHCPQPYAALAQLYRSHLGFGRAAELFHQAAERTHESALAGRYYFEEGFLHVRYTGDTERAIDALQQAERFDGWEGGAWHWGAASFFLGQALEAEGRSSEAQQAYQRVMDCQQCSYHHAAALDRLAVLSCKEDG